MATSEFSATNGFYHLVSREHIEVVDSTQTYLLENRIKDMHFRDYHEQLPVYAVSASHQTAGRGKGKRKWFSDQTSSCLALSLMFPVSKKCISKSACITQLLGLASVKAISKLCRTALNDSSVSLKWPNDIMIGCGKVGGILAQLEQNPLFGDFSVVVIGVGINIDIPPDVLLSGVVENHWCPVSIKSEFGISVEYVSLRDEIITQFVSLLSECFSPGDQPSSALTSRITEICSFQFGINKRVQFLDGDTVLTATHRGIDCEGGMVMELDDGRMRTFYSGELLHVD